MPSRDRKSPCACLGLLNARSGRRPGIFPKTAVDARSPGADRGGPERGGRGASHRSDAKRNSIRPGRGGGLDGCGNPRQRSRPWHPGRAVGPGRAWFAELWCLASLARMPRLGPSPGATALPRRSNEASAAPTWSAPSCRRAGPRPRCPSAERQRLGRRIGAVPLFVPLSYSACCGPFRTAKSGFYAVKSRVKPTLNATA